LLLARDDSISIVAGATVEGNDLSLFYGDEQVLTTTAPSQKFLPNEIYSQLVLNTVVCCVDILLVNTATKQCLLVLRCSEPVKGVWWLPGGRLLKGETFFDAAKRKAKEETGLTSVKPIQVLGVWNTFFPTSNWDTTQQKGTQTVNPIVLVEMESNYNNNNNNATIKLDDTSESYRWINLDPVNNMTEDRYVLQALLRLREWNPNYIQYKQY
jgi:ADP-ribose pyrophosphatase YjhB (NUDIX family)